MFLVRGALCGQKKWTCCLEVESASTLAFPSWSGGLFWSDWYTDASTWPCSSCSSPELVPLALQQMVPWKTSWCDCFAVSFWPPPLDPQQGCWQHGLLFKCSQGPLSVRLAFAAWKARRSCIVLSVLTRLWSQIKITFFGIVQQMLYMPQDYAFWGDHHFLWMNCNLSNVGWHGLWAHFWLPSTIRFWLGSSRCGESCWLIGGDDDDAAAVCRPSVGCMRSYKHAVLEVWWWWISGSMGCLPLPLVVSTGIATGRTMGFLGRLWLDRIPVMSLKWWL